MRLMEPCTHWSANSGCVSSKTNGDAFELDVSPTAVTDDAAEGADWSDAGGCTRDRALPHSLSSLELDPLDDDDDSEHLGVALHCASCATSICCSSSFLSSCAWLDDWLLRALCFFEQWHFSVHFSHASSSRIS